MPYLGKKFPNPAPASDKNRSPAVDSAGMTKKAYFFLTFSKTSIFYQNSQIPTLPV
jgi:hypothetical protein